jgi:hypothetical protein
MRFSQELTDEIDDLFDLLGTHLHIVSSQDFNHLHNDTFFIFTSHYQYTYINPDIYNR